MTQVTQQKNENRSTDVFHFSFLPLLWLTSKCSSGVASAGGIKSNYLILRTEFTDRIEIRLEFLKISVVKSKQISTLFQMKLNMFTYETSLFAPSMVEK